MPHSSYITSKRECAKGRPRANVDAAVAPAAARIKVSRVKSVTFPKQLAILKAHDPRDPPSAVSKSAPVQAGQTTKSCLKKTIYMALVVDDLSEEESSGHLENNVFEEKPTPAAAGKAIIQGIPRRWLVDTGCRFDLTSRSNLPFDDHEHIGPACMPVRLHTANEFTKQCRNRSQRSATAPTYVCWIGRPTC